MIRTKFAEIRWTPEGCVSKFEDGSKWGAHPHDTPEYRGLARRLGYGNDILTYCRHHDLCHHLVAEEFGRRSVVLWFLARGITPPRMSTASEEALALCLQRYVRTGEHPMVDRVDWDALAEKMLKHLENVND